MSQNHFTLSFRLKSPDGPKLLALQLPPLMPELFRANDTIGTVHYSRFRASGWSARRIDGHDPAAIAASIEQGNTVTVPP